MNKRQEFALRNPLNEARGDLAPYRTIERTRAGLLVAILAVDR